ncbi:MAG: hypothetical protein JNJ83_10055 [Verrucomicrobiaceae bacterium]|nr:hypothetical protein [Verrucomicrobiaceae bacterium]
MKKLALTLSFVSGCIVSWAQLPVQSPATNPSAPSDSGTRRRSSLFLAQIPQNTPVAQPGSGAIPGQNPNTIRPNIPRPAVTPVPRPGTAGSPARPQQPGVNPSAAPQQPIPAPQPAIGRQAPSPSVQNPPDAAPDTSGEELIDIQWVQFPMSQILLEYEKLTGKKIVRDINVESVSFTIETTGQLPKSQAIEYIEKSLLLNGYAFVPAGDGMLKFLNVAALKPGSEGTDIFNDPDDLPNDERIVTFVQPLQFLEAEDLKKSITELVPAHAYQVITALPNARGVIITDNSATIRYMLKLIEHLDVEPSRTDKRSFQLLRSSADKVAEALNEILDIESKKSGSSGGSSGGTRTAPPPPVPAATPAANGIPQQNPAAQAQARTPTPAAAGGNAPQAAAIPPKIIPIARTNKLLVIARPIDLAYIETLIEELDGASDVRNFISRPMKYMLATAALPVIEHAITRGMDDEGGSGTTSGGNSTLGANNNNSSANNTNNRSGDFSSGRSGGFGGNSGFGGGGYGSGGMGGSGFGGGGGLSSLGGDSMEPKSTVIGKTLIIADPNVNEIFASGPPDQLEALNQVLEQIDRRPRQVIIDAVIGELNVNDNKDFGIDYIMRPRSFGQGNNYGTVAGVARNDIVGDLLVDPSGLSGLDDFPNPSGLAIFGTLNDDLNFAIKALASTSNFKILSRPTLHTINNKPASIETGLKIPIPTSTLGSYNGGVSDPTVGGGVNSGFVSNIAYQDVSLRLDVAPLIYSDDELLLEVKQVNASTSGTTTISGNPIPNISNQGLQTTITVKNNATVLLGGLISETTDRQRNGIPILKDLPIIKYLTSSTKNFKKRNELLVFIRPRIVKGDGDVPTSAQDPAGASPLGGDMRKFINNEYVDPEQERSQIKRSRAARLFQKLFQ